MKRKILSKFIDQMLSTILRRPRSVATIIPDWYGIEKKMKALEKSLNEKYEEDVKKGEPADRKRIKARIKKQVQEAYENECEKAYRQKPWIR